MSSGTLRKATPAGTEQWNLKSLKPRAAGSLLLRPLPELGYRTELLEQNVGATLLHLLSAEIREGCGPLYHVFPINRSDSLLFCVPDTVIPGSSENAAGPCTNNNAGGAHLSSHGREGLRASTGWLRPWHRRLVSLAGKKSPYVSRHQLVGHLQRKSYCIHH